MQDQSTSTYHYRAMIETLLSFNKESVDTFLKTACYVKEEGKSIDQVESKTDDVTSGYIRRKGTLFKL